MRELAAKIAGPTGYYRRYGSSTMFEIKKQVGNNVMIIRLTVAPKSISTSGDILPGLIHISGDIQPGLQDLFQGHWDIVKAYTPDSSPTYMAEVYVERFPGREVRYYYAGVNYGGGYKTNFAVNAYTHDELACLVKLIFKVDIPA